jgi:hypothetical protein
MQLLSSPIVLALVCVLFFYGAGDHEARSGGNSHGILWAALSALTSAVALMLLNASWTFVLVAQVCLFFAIGIVRALHSPS